jgi:BirA family biotin operon repressor/biotin-[acetyl-CoA-carboxylase] ligase
MKLNELSFSTFAGSVPWRAQALWEQLRALLPGLSVEVVPRVASTNSVLLDRARVCDAQVLEGGQAEPPRAASAFGRRSVDWQPCLLVAEHQTGGRGRMGRTWHAAPGLSLTFSLALPLAPVSWSGLSLAVGVALADALEPPGAAAPQLGLKWPNDLWLRDASGTLGRKLGGILVETVSAGSKRLAVIGVGINVRPLEAAVTGGLGVACLDELFPGITVPDALARVALPLVHALQRFERAGFAPFAERYAARDLLYGRPVTLTHAEVREGTAAGVADDGALRIQSAHGLSHVSSGEVSVRLQPAPAARPPASLGGDT